MATRYVKQEMENTGAGYFTGIYYCVASVKW
jgi:hypothetical protein